MGFRIERGGGRDGTARDCLRLPVPLFSPVPSSPPGPMLLLRDFAFFLFSASDVPRSTVALSIASAKDFLVCRVVDMSEVSGVYIEVGGWIINVV